MERNIISWNITNWLTVLLMVAVGYTVVAAVVSMSRQFWSGGVMDAAVSADGTSLAA